MQNMCEIFQFEYFTHVDIDKIIVVIDDCESKITVPCHMIRKLEDPLHMA